MKSADVVSWKPEKPRDSVDDVVTSVADLVAASRARQGLPPTVTDSGALARVGIILLGSPDLSGNERDDPPRPAA